MNITINEPCHENWDAMTPNQQGAFCKSCQKNVVDFSKKTIEEIKNFFSKPQEGRVCGRFEETQLQELSFDDFFSRFRYWNFSRKFAVIFFLAFGFWLFSNEAMAQRETHMLKGEVAYYEPPKTVKKDTTKKHMTGQATIKEEPVIMGKIKCTRPEPQSEQKKSPAKDKPGNEPAPVPNEKLAVMGMVAFRPQEEKTPAIKTTVPVQEEYPVKQIKIRLVEETNKPAEEEKLASTENKILVYPNPNNGHFTVETKEKQVLNIFDENGRIVLNQEVSGTAQINAEHLKNGLYTVSLTGAGNPTIKKIIITR